MRELIERIVKQIVTKPDEVKVEEKEEKETTILQIFPAKEDMGLLIGKRGRVINALTSIARAAAGQYKRKVTIDILEK